MVHLIPTVADEGPSYIGKERGVYTSMSCQLECLTLLSFFHF